MIAIIIAIKYIYVKSVAVSVLSEHSRPRGPDSGQWARPDQVLSVLLHWTAILVNINKNWYEPLTDGGK